MNRQEALQSTITAMVQKGKGILAADENRRAYRSLLLSTPDLGKFISGVILFEETLERNSDDGVSLPELCTTRYC